VPNELDSFESYAYHCIYNKGVASGVPSKHNDLPINQVLENDYMKNLKRLADLAGLESVDFTMEGLDTHLNQAGWRPHIDTLAKLAENNIWIQKHFFTGKEIADDISYAVLILKKKNMDDKQKKNILSFVEDYGFRVVFDRTLTGDKRKTAEESLRGGVWADNSIENHQEYLPSEFLVVADLYTLNKNHRLFSHRVRLLKQNIRRNFDTKDNKLSIIHSTDTTQEAKEYIKTVFPESHNEVVTEVGSLKKNKVKASVHLKDKLELMKFSLRDRKELFKKELKIRLPL
jgi:hypothetical protein